MIFKKKEIGGYNTCYLSKIIENNPVHINHIPISKLRFIGLYINDPMIIYKLPNNIFEIPNTNSGLYDNLAKNT